jgi:hypothetical protein
MKIRNKFSKIVLASVLLLLGAQLLHVSSVSATVKSDRSKIPEFPPDAQRFNITDLAQQYFRHEFVVGSPQVIQFRNMTMLINATRNIEFNITADPSVNMRHFELNLGLDRSLMLNIRTMAAPPEEIPRPEDDIGRFITVEPNATARITATLRLHVDQEELNHEMNRYVERERLRWAFWNGTGWEPVTSWIDEHGLLTAEAPLARAWTIREMRNPPTIPPPDIPGVPIRVRAYNYTMVVPRAFRWTVRERGGVVFAFRNTVIMFNSTKNLELNITTGNDIAQRLLRFELSHGSPLRLDMEMQLGPPAGVEAATNCVGFYLGIEPNSTAPTNARLGMLIDREAIEAHLGRTIDPQLLRWVYWNGTYWVGVESVLDDDNVLEAETDHFSTWTIIETEAPEPQPEPEPEPQPEPEPEPEPMPEEEPTNTLLYMGVAAITVGAFLLLFIFRRKQ